MVLCPYVTSPHGLFVFGIRALMFFATGLNNAGSIRLLTKGDLSWMAPRALQAADANAVKSPASIAVVGTKLLRSAGSWRILVPWNPPKKKTLFLTTGPPSVPLYWFRFSVLPFVAK